ncbi:MAG: VOC family protein [Sphaerochaeta sp.]|jgi:lactoylglutathione lyase|uniref:VOC family protein n=1 Tax=Sphaerochaeta sp. TaxID=1972642 RepID=UPI003D0EA39F
MQFLWSTLTVRNMEESLAFYQEVVGLKLMNRMKNGVDTELAFLGDGETQVELLYHPTKETADPIGKGISLGFATNNLDQMLSFVQERGLGVEGPFSPNPMIKFFYVTDPNGLKIQFVERH